MTGELLLPVSGGSGVGDRPLRDASAARCGGRNRGGEGDDVDAGPSSTTSGGGDDGSVAVGAECGSSVGSREGESLRFL